MVLTYVLKLSNEQKVMHILKEDINSFCVLEKFHADVDFL